MLDRVTKDTFAPLVGERFELAAPGGEPFELVLTSCDEASAPSGTGTRTPFSLVFHAPPERLVPQQICTLRHPQIGQFELFVVPLGPDEQGMGYEVIFN